MNIVIFGLAKSGTTALFYKIKHALPPDTVCLFEPQSFDPHAVRKKGIGSLFSRAPRPAVLAKVLPFRPNTPADADSFSHFEKQILTVRDPRDRVISRLLYGIYQSNFYDQNHKLKAFLRTLQRKELNPHSVPVKTLLATFADLNGESFSFADWAASYRLHAIQKPLDFHEQHNELFSFKYEDMIDQRLGQLNDYLGLQLEGMTAVDQKLNRVTRTISYGAWRDWFTAEDVEYFGPVFQPFLARYYPEADWELNESPSIPAQHGSLYIERIVNERRATMKIPRFIHDETDG